MLVHEAAADTLIERLGGAVRVLDVGQAERFATEVPPVIEREAQERVLRYAAAGEPAGAGAVRSGRWLVLPARAGRRTCPATRRC